MSEHDDIRRALEELSSHPPHRDRKPAVRARVAVVRRRHQVSGGVAISIVTLLAGIAFTALGGGGAAPNEALLQTPSGTPTPAPAPAPSPRSSPIAATGRAAPGKPPAKATTPGRSVAPPQTALSLSQAASSPAPPTRTANPPAATAPLLTTPPATTHPATKPTVTGSPSSASSSSAAASTSAATSVPPTTGTGETLSADIAAATNEDGSAAPETVVTVRVHGTILGSIGNVTAWYTTVHHARYTDSRARACSVSGGNLHAVDETFTFRTRYRAAGVQQIDVVATTLDATCTIDAPQRNWPFTGAVSIPVGSSLSNGVAPVTVSVGTPQVQDSQITVNPSADDPDGYISAFTINWGSGNPEQFPGGNGANCSAGEYGGMFWPDGGGSGTFTSPVLPAGTYTVTVTATSTGCDGNDPEAAQQKLIVTVP